MSRILIIGASGGVGGLVLSHLLALSPVPHLRVSSRDPSKLHVPPSVEVVKADLADPSTYPALFKDIEKVFLYVRGTDKTATEIVKNAKESGVRHIVFLSSSAVLAPYESYLKQLHVKVENAIKEAGLTYTFLRAGNFATNTKKMWAPQIKYSNKIVIPYPNSHSVPLADEDTAAVAVIALTSNSPLLTGPKSITQREQIEILSKARQETVGEPVAYEVVSPEKWKEVVAGKFVEEIVNNMLRVWPTTEGVPQPISPEFEKITGKPGTQYADWVQLHKHEFF